MRRGACGLADLLDFEEEEGGSFSFISSKSARPCSARPEQTRRVACLQGCFFAELAHTRPATTSREPVEPPRADSEHPPKVALATASREPLEPPRAGSEHPPKVALAADAGESSAAGLPRKTTPPTLASRAPLARRGRRRLRLWNLRALAPKPSPQPWPWPTPKAPDEALGRRRRLGAGQSVAFAGKAASAWRFFAAQSFAPRKGNLRGLSPSQPQKRLSHFVTYGATLIGSRPRGHERNAQTSVPWRHACGAKSCGGSAALTASKRSHSSVG